MITRSVVWMIWVFYYWWSTGVLNEKPTAGDKREKLLAGGEEERQNLLTIPEMAPKDKLAKELFCAVQRTCLTRLQFLKITHFFITTSIDCISILETLWPSIIRQSEVIFFQLSCYSFLKLYKYCIFLHRKSYGQHLKCPYDVLPSSHTHMHRIIASVASNFSFLKRIQR